MNGSLGISGGLTLSLSTENAATAKYIYQMLLEIYQIRAEIRVHQKTTLSKIECTPFLLKIKLMSCSMNCNCRIR